MDSEQVETRVIGAARLTGPARLLDQIRTATELDMTTGTTMAGHDARLMTRAADVVPPDVVAWMLDDDRAPGAA